MKEKLFGYIDAQQDLLLDLQRGMTALPAIGPDNNGSGEAAKAEFIKERLAALGFPPVHSLNSPDPRVPAGFRPNFYTVLPGKDCSKTLWIAAHIDVVPPGDRALWRTDPFNLHVEGDFIYGRGVEDNQQAITSAIIAAKALLDLNLAPACNLGLLFLSDEETNNQHGAIYVAENCSNLFGPNDMMLVPDAGDQAGSLLEVAEKGVLWLKFTVNGRQCHASTPNQGVNSLLGAADLILRLNRLNDIFNLSDPLFDPPTSTFTPTQKEANVPNVNTMPGRDVFYLDCRILPDLSGDVVLTKVRELMRETEAALGVECLCEVIERREPAPASDPNLPFMRALVQSVYDVYGLSPIPVGIGGNTVAAVFRKLGVPCAIWARIISNAHMPDECSRISWTLGDAKVFAGLALTCQ